MRINEEIISNWLKGFDFINESHISKIFDTIDLDSICNCINYTKYPDFYDSLILRKQTKKNYLRASAYDGYPYSSIIGDEIYAPISINYINEELTVIYSESDIKAGEIEQEDYITKSSSLPVVDLTKQAVVVIKRTIDTKTLEGTTSRTSYNICVYTPKARSLKKLERKIRKNEKKMAKEK